MKNKLQIAIKNACKENVYMYHKFTKKSKEKRNEGILK